MKGEAVSYWSQSEEETACDFPECVRHFEHIPDAKVAILKNGKTLAFCAEHTKILINAGVILKSLNEIREDRLTPARMQEKARRMELELKFITDLKNPD
ncbi:MAG: hypothetical protein AAB345_03835 [Patescibacteria group bacterium]